jgi:type II secretory pathway component PulJ
VIKSGANRRGGVALIECMVYIAILSLVLALGFAAFIEAVERATRMDRKATQIVQAVQAGEQWRADIRQAIEVAKIVPGSTGAELQINTGSKQIAYMFRDGTVLRRIGESGLWLPFLEKVKASQFHVDQRQNVIGFRWEVELAGDRETRRIRPVFTFQAAIRPHSPINQL